MPVHLPPLSRRAFLQRSLMAGLGLALAPSLRAAGIPRNKNRWAFFSDVHIAADRAQIARQTNMADNFSAATRDLLAQTERPAGLFLTGDCAWNSGEPGDYATFAGLLDPLRGVLPVHLLLGNHDNREHFWDAFKSEKAVKRPLADRQVALIKTARVNWFLLDSLEKTLSTPGLIGPDQLAWLEKSLDANRRQPAVLLVHHNLDAGEKSIGLKDTEALFQILRPRKQVKACVFGHTHNWDVATDSSGIHLVNLPPTAYVFKAGNPNGWVSALVEADGMELELRCLDAAHPAHGQKRNLKWRAV
ncbi:MAG: metallophosphoesterase [Verrucomicrobiota bacterium]